jgi:hypothetical protein
VHTYAVSHGNANASREGILSTARPDNDSWARVEAYLGKQLVQHVLATEESVPVAEMSTRQIEVASSLVQAFATSQLQAWNALRRWEDIRLKLCSHNDALGMSPAAHMHEYCGGDSPTKAISSDPLEDALCALAKDTYPLFLIGGMGDGSQFHVQTSLHSHPGLAATLEEMFRPEEPLMNIFSDVDYAADPLQRYEIRAHVQWSNGGGDTVAFSGIPQAILLRASGASVSGKSALNAYILSVRQTLSTARSLASGRKTKVSAIVACYSTALADDVIEIVLTEGRFRHKTAIDHYLIQESPHENVVLEIPMELQLAGQMDLDADGFPSLSQALQKSGEDFHEDLQRRISRARMAVLLSSKADETLAVGQSFSSVPNPLTLNLSNGRSPLAWPVAPFQSRPLESADEATIQGWDALLAGLPSGVRTGQERLLAAVSERFSPHDGFIDAVIAWENLFGAAGDTTLRVCGSLAALLHPDDSGQRNEFYKEITKVYGQKSKLVHGGENRMTSAEATEIRNRSVGIAVDAWREVLRSPELRSAKTSEDRGKLVLIHGVRSPATPGS